MTGRPTATTTACTRCGGPVYASDRFCGACGAITPSGLVAAASTPPDSPTLDAPTQPVGFTSFDGWERIVQRLRAATVGEFEIRRELGRGGMAIVFLAVDLALRRKVAIKLMSPGLLTNDEMVRKFREEAVMVAQMSHPNIISIHAVRAVEDLHFFIMKFVEGQSLDQLMRETGALPLAVARGFLHQVGNALAYAHRRGIIHRDIKPANILIDVDGEAYVTDFGIAKAIDSETHTKTGSVVGTPAYMSPEQCYALPATWASDQYSLGVVAYEMIAGTAPFTGPSFVVMKAHADGPVPPIRDVRPDCPPDLEAAVLRMLEKKPEDRFASIAQAMAALGASPLPEHDLHRVELVAHVREAVPPAMLTPVSPVPAYTRDRPIGARSSTPSPPPSLSRPSPPAPAPAAPPSPPAARPEAATVLLGPSDANTAKIDRPGTSSPASSAAEAPAAAPSNGMRRVLGVGAMLVVVAAVLWLVVPRRSPDASDGIAASPPTVAPTAAPITSDSAGGATAQQPAPVPATQPPPVAAPASPATTPSVVPAAPSPAGSANAPPATPPPAKSIAILPAELTLMVGQTVAPDVTVLGADNRALPGRRVVWVSPNVAIATVDRATGAVTGVTVGTTDLFATSGGARGTLRVHVEAPVVLASISVDQPRRLTVGDNVTLSATARDSRGNVMATQAMAWSSSNPAVATIGASTGIVTAAGPGSTDISASAGGQTSTVRLTVVAPAPPPESPKTAAADAAAEERRARAAIESAVQEYVGVLRAHNGQRVTSLYRAESDQDRKNERSLMRLMESAAKLTAAEPRVKPSRIDGTTASVDFTVPMTWRNPFGRIREQAVTFRAELQRAGTEWRISNSRVVGVLTP